MLTKDEPSTARVPRGKTRGQDHSVGHRRCALMQNPMLWPQAAYCVPEEMQQHPGCCG